MRRTPAEARGLAALLAGAVCIGFAPIWVRWSEVGPVATAFCRLALALPVMALWAAHERPASTSARSPRRRASAGWSIAAGTMFALDLAAWHLSIRLTSVANATLLGNLAPVFVTLGAWLFLGEQLHRRFLGGMCLALLGAWFLSGATPGMDPSRLRGDLLGVITAAFYGGYQLCVARLRRDHPAGRVLLFSSLVCTPLLGLLSLALGEALWPVTARGWWVVVGLAVTAQILGQGLIIYGFAHLPAGLSSLTLLLQPLVAALAGWMLLGERLGLGQGFGGALLLLGLYAARRPAPPSNPENPDDPGVSTGASRPPR